MLRNLCAVLCACSARLNGVVQDLIKETKRRFKFMNHQIEQLKDEITIMDHCLVRTVCFVWKWRYIFFCLQNGENRANSHTLFSVELSYHIMQGEGLASGTFFSPVEGNVKMLPMRATELSFGAPPPFPNSLRWESVMIC